MIRRTFKLAWFKRNRYVLTVVAIALSVAFIVSTLLLTTSIADVGDPINDAYADVDAVVVGPEIAQIEGPADASITAPVSTDVVGALNDAGYEAVGFTTPYAQVIDVDGNAAGQEQASSNLAEPWLGSSPLNGFDLADGTAPSGIGEAVLDQATAAGAGLMVGDTFTYVTDAGLGDAELVGIASFGGEDNNPYTSTLLLDPTDPLFTPGLGYDYVLVAAGDGSETGAAEIGSETLLDDVAALTPGAAVSNGAEWAQDRIDLVNGFLGFFETFLTIFAVIAVVVGMVIVTNTFTVSLAQRTEELALLRLVGTTRRQLMGQVVLEAGLLGAVGTIIGVVGGIAGVNLLGSFLDLLGLSIERSSAIAPSAIAAGVAVGLGVTVAAAVWPARKATAVAPIEALRSAELEPPSAARRRGVAALAAALVGAGLLIYGAVETDIWFTGFGIGGAFAALYLGAEYLIRLAARLARPILGTTGPAGTLASRNLERNAGRTSAASSALMIGITLIAFFTLMAATISEFMAGDAANALRTDHVVQGIGAQPEAVIGDEILADLAATDGVDQVVAVYQTPVQPGIDADVERAGPGGENLAVAMADIDGLTDAYEFEVISGSIDEVAGNAVIIDEFTAGSYRLEVGDTLPITALAGSTDLEVAAVVTESLPGTQQAGVIGAEELAVTLGYDDPATTVYVLGSADEATLTEAVGLPTVDVLTIDGFIDSLSSGLDTILALVYALLAVAVIIALVGIANTVSLAISERVGEIAAIRAAGGSARQVFWSLISEFSLLALVGVGSGLALAWVSAAAFFRALSEGQIDTPNTSIITGVLIVVVGLIGGAMASWLPSRSASRSDILEVLRAE